MELHESLPYYLWILHFRTISSDAPKFQVLLHSSKTPQYGEAFLWDPKRAMLQENT